MNGWKIFNLIKKQVVPSSKVDSSENITVWEVEGQNGNNNFPQQLLQNVYNSPAGSAAIDLWHEFVEGDGIADNAIGEITVNKSQTIDDLHGQISADISSMWGFSVLVSYSIDGKKKTFKHMPFEGVRLGDLSEDGITDKIYFNPYYGTKDYDKKDTKCFYTYNPDPELVKGQILNHNKLLSEGKVKTSYPGQVYWFSIERPLARVYPQPFYYSAISWFQVDASIQKFHARNIDNNFLLSVLINKFGNPDAPAGDKNSDGDFTSTVGEEFNKQMSSFAGAENAGAVMVNWYSREEEKADIAPFPNNTNETIFTTIQTLVSDQIAIGTKVPRILLGIVTSGKLGDSQEVLNAVKVMQGRTKRMRNILSSQYARLFDGFKGLNQESDYTIKNVNLFDILPDWAIEVLTPKQRDKYISENFNIEIEVVPEEKTGIIEEPILNGQEK